jgi:predicted GH43/DUF377 family glycosyl hydrolase
MLNLVQESLQNKGFIKPLLIPSNMMKGISLINPSIINIKNNLYINLRNVNYTLFHSETRNTEHQYGPLCYLHPEHDPVLKTYNILCKLNKKFNIEYFSTIDTSNFDEIPLWEFIGLEDARIVNWNNKLYLNGVRRDTTTNGQGRIELSEISFDNLLAKEISRIRIPSTQPDQSYCEKNWMPILDKPYHWIKWTNPTELVYYNNHQTQQICLKNKVISNSLDLRGGSQVIPYKEFYLAIVHETELYFTDTDKKNVEYYHRFILWDKNFNILTISDRYKFMNGKIEFCCGLCEYKNLFLITFGFQDNCSYLLGCDKTFINKILCI